MGIVPSTYLSFRHHHSHPALPPPSSSLMSSSSPIIKIRLRVNVGVQVPCCRRRHHHPSDRELVFATLVVYFIASLVFTVSSILSVESWYYSIFYLFPCEELSSFVLSTSLTCFGSNKVVLLLGTWSGTLAVISDKRRCVA